MLNIRPVHLTKRFKDELEQIKSNYERVSDFTEAATKALRIKPKEAGTFVTMDDAIEDTEGIYMISMVETMYNPPVIIFYEFDYSNVWLLSIKVSDLEMELF